MTTATKFSSSWRRDKPSQSNHLFRANWANSSHFLDELWPYEQIKNQLDQVYCAWLIKWVLKREIIQLAELCLSRWWIKSGTWWYWISIWRYSLVLGQYKLELLGFRWYRVSKGLECLYILEKVEIWSGDTDASLTDWLTDRHQNIELLSLSPV